MTVIRDYQEKRKRVREAQEAEKQLVEKQEDAIKNLAEDQNKYNLLESSLKKDLARISSLPLNESRNELKRNELIPKYSPYIDAYLERGEVYRNEILVQVMIWSFDTGDINFAIKLAEIAIDQKQPMPQRFKRNTISFVADAFLEWCKVQFAHSDSVEPYFTKMFEKVIDWNIHNAIKMKYYKFAGEMLEYSGKTQEAYKMYLKAFELDPIRAKVKTKLEKLSP